MIFLGDGVGNAVYNAIKCILGYYVIPFWWIYTFAIIYTILLFSFQKIKNHIRKIMIALLTICFAMDLFSFFEIFVRNGYFVQAVVSQRFRIWTWLMYFCLGYLLGDSEKVKRKKGMRYVVPAAVLSGKDADGGQQRDRHLTGAGVTTGKDSTGQHQEEYVSIPRLRRGILVSFASFEKRPLFFWKSLVYTIH